MASVPPHLLPGYALLPHPAYIYAAPTTDGSHQLAGMEAFIQAALAQNKAYLQSLHLKVRSDVGALLGVIASEARAHWAEVLSKSPHDGQARQDATTKLDGLQRQCNANSAHIQASVKAAEDYSNKILENLLLQVKAARTSVSQVAHARQVAWTSSQPQQLYAFNAGSAARPAAVPQPGPASTPQRYLAVAPPPYQPPAAGSSSQAPQPASAAPSIIAPSTVEPSRQTAKRKRT
ncbi:unnamed protein product [Tilletia controversa]|nr:unnamed protein product [Tilletia controversa]